MDVGRGFSPARFGEAEASPYVKKDFSLCPPPAGAQGVVLEKAHGKMFARKSMRRTIMTGGSHGTAQKNLLKEG